MVAVLVPTTILSVVQYRSLVELEDKTKVAVEENLRQTLLQISRKLDGKFRKLAADNLYIIDPKMVIHNSCSQNAEYLSAIKKQQPYSDEVFAVSNSKCSGSNKEMVIVACNVKVEAYDDPYEADKNPEVMRISKYFRGAQLMQDHSEMARGPMFYQDAMSAGIPNSGGGDQVYSFLPLATPSDPFCGFIGMSYSKTYIKKKFLPAAIEETIKGPELGMNSLDLDLVILDENHEPIYASNPWRKDYEVWTSFAPIFPRWKLELGYKNTTIESLARSNFQKSLTLTLMLVALLVTGIILTLRATAREMRLAQSKSTFVSNVSHELKTPLALIRLFAETLELGRVKNDEKAHEYYRIINNESRRLTQLINNILDFSKIEAGRKEYDFVPANVGDVVEEVIKSYEYQITNAGFELGVDIQRDLPLVTIDRDAISQAVLNLLNNAVKYSDETKKIEISVRTQENNLAITVTDHGIGIPRSEHKKIFEKFYRVSTGLVHDTKGSGLGLSLVKHIVEAHRGQIDVDSTPGKGSQFTILIPIAKDQKASEETGHGGINSGGYQVAENLDS